MGESLIFVRERAGVAAVLFEPMQHCISFNLGLRVVANALPELV
jgi:hypothetical protein